MKLIFFLPLLIFSLINLPECEGSRKVRCGSTLVDYWRRVCSGYSYHSTRLAIANRYNRHRRRRPRRSAVASKFLKQQRFLSQGRMSLLEFIAEVANDFYENRIPKRRRGRRDIVSDCCKDRRGCGRNQVLRYCRRY